MKHARKALVFLILLVTPLLLAGVLPLAIDNEVETIISPITMKVNAPSYEVQTPILAYNDFDMDNYASALSWEGNGMPDTPYIIEGYNITDNGDCILIQDTTRAFEIRNCYISSIGGGQGNGIVIHNATQVAIFDTVVEDKSDGIIIDQVPASYLENCTIHGSGTGLFAAFCPGLTIYDCRIYEIFDYCVALLVCNDTMISHSEIYDTIVGPGIRFDASYNVVIADNHISHCMSSGIWAVVSPFAIIENNIIHDNSFFTGPMCGVHLEDSDHASIVSNEIYSNAMNGIFLEWSDWAYIFDNEIYDNADHGIDVMFCINGTILQNDIHGNGWWPIIINALCGIYMGPSIDFVIADNSIWNNTPSGISIEDGERISIYNNHIFNNSDTGIYANAGEGNSELEIFGNEIHHNGFSIISPHGRAGILMYGYEECLVANNLVYNNTDYGISVNGDSNRIVGNEVSFSETGIGSEECSYNLISENMVFGCIGGILLVNIGSNVTNNIVFDNEYGIYVDHGGDNRIYGNDIGWNTMNAYEAHIFGGLFMLWDDNVSIGNHWHDYDGGGTYTIWNSTDATNIDRFPSISLNISQASPVDFEILETGNVIEWDAYALNPSHYEVFVDGASVLVEEWDGDDIEYVADGLSHGTHTIEVQVFHISGHSMDNDTTADVEDLTPPSAIEGPSLVNITLGDVLSVPYSSDDPSGLEWAVNDTVNFEISSTGVLTSLTDLTIGDYIIQISVSDPYGHTTVLDVTISVRAAGGGLPTTLLLAIGAGGAVVILVVVIIGYKTKKG